MSTNPPPWHPDPVRQKLANYTIEDVLDLPSDAPRVELVDGRMLPLPSPRIDHQRISFLLTSWLVNHTPRERWQTIQAVGIAVSADHTFEPDVMVLDVDVDPGRHYVAPEQVALVVEIVSPGTRRRDRIEKPADYAAAGIRHYWRIELDPVHVYAYQRATSGHYELVADSAELLELAEPFAIKLAVAEITP